jgi:hypothetical protein
MTTTRLIKRRVTKGTLPEAQRWSFAQLFTNGEVGATYDPSDRLTLFQDTAGATPVTAPGQPVGLILDKSRQSAFSTETVRNLLGFTEEFENTYWNKNLTASTTSNTATDPLGGNTADAWTCSGQFGSIRSPAVSRPTGQYTVSVWARVASGTRQFHLGITENGEYLLQSPITVTTEWQRFTTTLNHTNASFTIRFLFQDRASSGFVPVELWGAQLESGSTMSAYQKIEYPLVGGIWHGRHAFQATAAARPTYGIVPKVGRRNLINNTDNFTSTAWVPYGNFGHITRATEPGLLNGLPVGRFTVANTNNNVYAVETTATYTVAAMQKYVVKMTFKDVNHGQVMLAFGSTAGFACRGRFSLIDGSLLDQVKSSNNFQSDDWVSSANSDGSYTIQAVVWSTTSVSTPRVIVYISTSSAVTGSPAIGSAILVSAPSLEIGEVSTAYQQVNTVFNITEPGVESCHYLQFDGVDDSLSTPTVDFTGTDKLTIAAGFRKLSDATQGIIHELSANLNSNTGSSYLVTGTNTTTGPNYAAASRGSATAILGHGATSNPSFASPISNTIVATHDIAGSLTALRINGADNGTTGVASKGTGNYGNYAMFIGRRGGSSLPLNGQLFALNVRGALPTTTELRQTEKLLAKKTVGTIDLDAVDYFARVAAAGGIFASAAYTDRHTRQSILNWFTACKDLGVYNKIAEAYLFVGPSYAGVYQKLKHAGVPALTNVNFSSSNHVQAGTGSGLKGNASSCRLETGWFPNSVMTTNTGSLGIYAEDMEITTGGRGFIMTADAALGTAPHCAILNDSTVRRGAISSHWSSPTSLLITVAQVATAFEVVSRVSATDFRWFRNGTQLGATNTLTNAGITSGSLGLFSFRYGTGTGSYSHNSFSAMRAKFAFAGTGLTTDDVSNLTTATNGLLTDLGSNVF